MNRAFSLIVAIVALAGVFLGAAIGFAEGTRAQPRMTNGSQPPIVLFLCPHGAAESVLASAYFQRLANERGLNVRVMSAGTDPDPNVAPAVARHLSNTGHDVPVTKPRRATAADMATADVVISIGCDLKGLPAPRGTLVSWDDVPALSEDFSAADAKIRERVIQLVDELARKSPR